MWLGKLFHSSYLFFNKGNFALREEVFLIELAIDIRDAPGPVDIRSVGKILQRHKSPSIFGIVLCCFENAEHRTGKLCLDIFEASLSLYPSIKSSPIRGSPIRGSPIRGELCTSPIAPDPLLSGTITLYLSKFG